MSRLITLPDGRQVHGGKNYVVTPKPGLLIDQRVEVQPPLDTTALKAGAALSLYIKGETSNKIENLRVAVVNSSQQTVEVTPDQFKAGHRLNFTKTNTDPCSVVFNINAGSYKLWHFALMLTDEMDEMNVVKQFNQYYP